MIDPLRSLRAGVIVARGVLPRFERPSRVLRATAAAAPWGTTMSGLLAATAQRAGDRIALIDEDRDITYRELWDRARRLGGALSARGIGPGHVIGLLGRNHVGFVEWLAAGASTGADIVLLNTGAAAPQLADIVEHEHIDLILHDEEFADIAARSGADTIDEHECDALADGAALASPRRTQGRIVILTSGTTGRPKGAARRSDQGSLDGAAAVLQRIPLRHGDNVILAAPLFHSWGLSHLLFGLGRTATMTIARRFDAEATLRALVDQDAEVLVVVPVMLARMLDLPDDVLDDIPNPSLRVIASSGSALGSRLATAVLDRFGPVLYNLYGSTEVAVATIATPDDLREAPSTAGRVAFGVRVKILDGRGRPVPDGTVGRIFVGGSMRFDGYTDGLTKEQRDGMLSSGDVGVFRDGLLFVEGREDDMIVSGGENVFPGEVEDLLEHHPAIKEVAVVGVPDDEFGQALAAFVVTRPRARLTADDVRHHVRAELANYKVPRVIEFLDQLPRNATGKVLRRTLAASC